MHRISLVALCAALPGLVLAGTDWTDKLSSLLAVVHLEGVADGPTGYMNFTWTPTGVEVKGYQLAGFGDTTLTKGYSYHIHTNRVPKLSDTSKEGVAARCKMALGHLDPLRVTSALTCSPLLPQYCQVGDLSGKHGGIMPVAGGQAPVFDYLDAYLRFFPQPFSLLGRSVVVHGENGAPVACGNIESFFDETVGGGGSVYQTDYPKEAPPAPSAAVAFATDSTVINSAGISSIGATIPNAMPDPQITQIVLATVNSLPAAVATTYTAGENLPRL